MIEKACGYAGDMVCLAVAMPQSTTPYLDLEKEEWEETCLEFGFEYVDIEAKGKNEFGEEMGVKRVEEALKANEWEGGDGDGFGFDDDEDFGEFGDGGGLDAEEREMGAELFGMKSAVHGLGEEGEEEVEETQVEELESLMRRMVAIKGMLFSTSISYLLLCSPTPETSEAMPEEARKRFAAKAVNDLIKDL